MVFSHIDKELPGAKVPHCKLVNVIIINYANNNNDMSISVVIIIIEILSQLDAISFFGEGLVFIHRKTVASSCALFFSSYFNSSRIETDAPPDVCKCK